MASGIYTEIKKRIAYAIARSFRWIIAPCEDVALKTLGKERIDDSIILSLKNRLPEAKKKKMLEEATGVSEWILGSSPIGVTVDIV